MLLEEVFVIVFKKLSRFLQLGGIRAPGVAAVGVAFTVNPVCVEVPSPPLDLHTGSPLKRRAATCSWVKFTYLLKQLI